MTTAANVAITNPARRALPGLRLATLGIGAGLLAGCNIGPVGMHHRITLSEPPAPVQSGPNPAILRALTCMRESHVLNKIRFGIAVHSDGTGKSQYGYTGATGSFLPQGTAAIWASETVIRAGGLAMNYYELNTERALRQFGGNQLDQALAQQQQARVPNFIISTAFTALDFLGGPSVDVEVGGVGPYYNMRGASLEVSAEMYRPGDRMTMAISSLSRQVFYRDGGFNVARYVGANSATLVTGAIGFSDQQRLQEATRDVIALSVADVLASMPIVPDNCRKLVESLKTARPLPTDPAAAGKPTAKAARGSDPSPLVEPAGRQPSAAANGPVPGTAAGSSASAAPAATATTAPAPAPTPAPPPSPAPAAPAPAAPSPFVAPAGSAPAGTPALPQPAAVPLAPRSVPAQTATTARGALR